MAKNWIEIDYEYNGQTVSIAELGYETAICRIESLTSAGAKIIRVEEQDMAKKALYKYGMRLRGFSIGCQPKKGFVDREDDPRGRYYDIIIYDRMLTGDEVADYELTYLGKVE